MPNLAVATELRNHCGPNSGPNRSSNCGVELLYVGSRRPLDRELVEAVNLPFKSIFAGKLRRYFSWRYFIDPLLVVIGFFQSLWILISFWPHAVFTKGGFVSVPVALAAFILRRPIVLHESDSRMGIANRIVSRLARRVCISFPGVSKESERVIFTGNPIRLEIKDGHADKGYQLTGFRPDKPIVLVWGGSQGAREINDLIAKEFHNLVAHFQIVHITGKGKQTALKDFAYVQFEYLGDELKHIYAITDLVVGRAGANSLYELAFARKPNVLIPLKNADQMNNAQYFQTKGGSIVLKEDQSLYQILNALWHNQVKYESMKRALADLARPDATKGIANLILGLATKN